MRIIAKDWSIWGQWGNASAVLLSLLFLSGVASAQTTNTHHHRFGVSYRPGFNITAKFHEVQSGGFGGGINPGSASGGSDHTYADGYNKVDIAGNNHGGDAGTWNWGYNDASQIQGNAIAFHAVTSSGRSSPASADGDPQHGVEITYNGQLGQIRSLPWGVEAALSFTDLTIRAKARGTQTRITDLYDLGGVVPPAPVYRGNFEGPAPGGPNAPVIGDVPQRTAESSAVTGRRDVDAQVWGLRLGPYVDIPLASRWTFTLSGGFAAAWLNSEFHYQDTATPTGGVPLVTTGSNEHKDWAIGGFAAGNISFAMTESLHLFGGVQYQSLSDFSQKAGGKRAELDLSNSIFVTVGCGFSF
jgi:hypothetical protein